MRMVHRSLVFSLLLLVLAFGTIDARASNPNWKRVAFPGGVTYPNYPEPYFLNPNLGFKFIPGVIFNGQDLGLSNAQSNLYRTTDGGVTWTSIDYFTTLNCAIAQMYFVSANHGYIAATLRSNFDTTAAAGGIYETLDTGATWRKISPKRISFGSVYAVDNLVYATAIDPHTTSYPAFDSALMFTADDGKTWNSVTKIAGLVMGRTQQFSFVTGNKDYLIAAVYFDAIENSTLVYSTDQGQTWLSTTLDPTSDLNMMSLFCVPHSQDIIREYVPWWNRTEDTYSFLRSSKYFSASDTVISHKEIGGWMAGTSCVQYVSSASDYLPGAGVLRSVAPDPNWYHYDGPSFDELDDQDFQNLSVVGYGAVVYAGDLNLSMWKTINGGDGTLSVKSLAPAVQLSIFPSHTSGDTLLIPQCDSLMLQLQMQNLSCSLTHLTKLEIEGLNGNEYWVTPINLHPNYDLPYISSVMLTPFQPGVHQIKLHAQFTDDEYAVIDTSFAFTLIVSPNGGPSISIFQNSAQLSGVSGDLFNIPVYVTTSSPYVLPAGSIIDLSYAINNSALKALDFQTALAGLQDIGDNQTSSGMDVGLKATTRISLSGTMLVGWLRCSLELTDSSRASVVLNYATIGASSKACLGQTATNDTVLISRNYSCGDSTLLHFMHGVPLNSVLSIDPNPATSSIRVRLNNALHALIAYTLFDALGRTRLNASTTDETIQIDLSGLTNGTYYLRTSSAEGTASTRQVIVRR
jgi:photosystem II stability/assembly factor-like uncharacterized protein